MQIYLVWIFSLVRVNCLVETAFLIRRERIQTVLILGSLAWLFTGGSWGCTDTQAHL